MKDLEQVKYKDSFILPALWASHGAAHTWMQGMTEGFVASGNNWGGSDALLTCKGSLTPSLCLCW